MFYRTIYLLSVLALSGMSSIYNLAQAADEPIELIITSPVKKTMPLPLASKDLKASANTAGLQANTNPAQTYVKSIPLQADSVANISKIIPESVASIQPVTFEEIKVVSFQNQDIVDIDKTNIQSKYSKNDASLWNRIRAGFTMPNLDNERASEKTLWYAARPEYFSRINERASKYLYHIVEELEKRNMPLELALLPIVESAFNPIAKSSVKAAGIWQFMPKTGKYFNLEQNMFVDERRDVLSSTTAALDYLQKLYNMFGDWHLALAAYNWGEGSVSKAISRNKIQGLPTGYADISMPHETKYYVPKLQAVKNIIASPEKYGIALVDIPNHPYFITVTTAKDIDVEIAAQLANMPLSEFKSINPSFNRQVIIGATKPQILLPWDKAEKFQENLKNYKSPLSTVTAITLNQKEKVEALAGRFGVDASLIRSINNIGKGFRFKAGSTVLLPKVGALQSDISENIAENGKISTERDTPELKKVFIYVYKHDTLSTIADRYDVSVSQLKAWNKINSGLKRGQKLTLVVPYNKVIHVQRPYPELNTEHRYIKNHKKTYTAKIKYKKYSNDLDENRTNNYTSKKEKHAMHAKSTKIVKIADKKQHVSRN